MTLQYQEFIRANEWMFKNSVRLTQEQKQIIYTIYNDITGETKKPNGCGRCLANVKKRILTEYQKLNGKS